MIFHCMTTLDNSLTRTSTPPSGFFVWFILSQGLALFWKASNIIHKHACLCGNDLCWVVQWLSHMSYCHMHMIFHCKESSMTRTSPPPTVFFVWCILFQGSPLFWKASYIIPQHICLCGNDLCWVVQWLSHIVTYTWFFHCRTRKESSTMTRTSPPPTGFVVVVFLPKA